MRAEQEEFRPGGSEHQPAPTGNVEFGTDQALGNGFFGLMQCPDPIWSEEKAPPHLSAHVSDLCFYR